MKHKTIDLNVGAGIYCEFVRIRVVSVPVIFSRSAILNDLLQPGIANTL